MSKPKIFISHITEEAELAIVLKQFIEKKFLKTLDVFASSHEESVKLGDDWLGTIKISLNESKLIIILCSPISVVRPWINFEAGAGWLKNIPIIPLCHSGLTPGNLPVPINSFQGGILSDSGDIKKLFQRIAEILDIETPDSNDTDFFKITEEFQLQITNSLLIKDTTFVYSFLLRQIDLLKFCIYNSTLNFEESSKIDIRNHNLADYKFTFNSIHNLFNPCLLEISRPKQRVFQLFIETIQQLKDNIKFILSYHSIEISPALRDVLNSFLFSVVRVGDWSMGVDLVHINSENKLEEMMIKMIKEEPLPLKRREHNNLTHYFFDYYDSLLFYQQWILEFEKETKGILEKN